MIDVNDFFNKDLSNPIKIHLTFHSFSDEEKALFLSRIHSDEMTVVRIFDSPSGRGSGRYHGSTKQHAGFAEIRSSGGATAKRDAYNSLRTQDERYASLRPVRQADEIDENLTQWEVDHPTECELRLDDGQFFGFTNVANGSLQKHTSFVFVPAVRDASADVTDARGAAVSQLMELIVRSAVLQRNDIKALQDRVRLELKTITSPENMPEIGKLSTDLSATLKQYYEDAGVELRWKDTQDFTIPLPAADVILDHDGFPGPVDRQGHGLQRAFILSLLQHLARAVSSSNSAATSDPTDGHVDGHAATPAKSVSTLPGLILAIEEPELYQHPTKQRHFARVLSQLSDGILPGVAVSTQVIFASHSPLFVSMERFDEVRIARRKIGSTETGKECCVVGARLDAVVSRLEAMFSNKPGTYTADTLRPRLHIINTEIAEGLFADTVVLVEGPSDKAAIIATCALLHLNLEAMGIAILAAGCKNNLDRPAVIFRELGIETYVIWDCDLNLSDNISNKERKIEMQRALLKMCDQEIDGDISLQTIVGRRFACFEQRLEKTLAEEIGDEIYTYELQKLAEQYNLAHDDIQKSPQIMHQFLRATAQHGVASATLQSIVEKIVQLKRGAVIQ
jgi:hypothetical protein